MEKLQKCQILGNSDNIGIIPERSFLKFLLSMSSVGEQVDPVVGPGGLRFRERGSICPTAHGSGNSGKESLRLPQ